MPDYVKSIPADLEAEHLKYWKYPERTCTQCVNYPCFDGMETLDSDFAKYGCFQYERSS